MWTKLHRWKCPINAPLLVRTPVSKHKWTQAFQLVNLWPSTRIPSSARNPSAPVRPTQYVPGKPSEVGSAGPGCSDPSLTLIGCSPLLPPVVFRSAAGAENGPRRRPGNRQTVSGRGRRIGAARRAASAVPCRPPVSAQSSPPGPRIHEQKKSKVSSG